MEDKILYRTDRSDRSDPSDRSDRSDRSDPVLPARPERLDEPDLSFYLALRRQYDLAQVQAATLSQALASLNPILERRYQLGPNDAIDAEGYIHRREREE